MNIGDQAPDFSLPDQHGNTVRLSEILGEGPVVVYFYPKAGTPGCTKEACAFRDVYAELVDAGAKVVGISGDTVAELAAFAKERRLPFTLLSDAAGEVRGLWHVPRDFVVMAGRVTYVLDAGGVVRRIIRSAVNMEKHVEEARAEVGRLRGAGEGSGKS